MSRTKTAEGNGFRVDSRISDEWICHGLNVEPADRAEAEKHIKEAYRRAGLIVPRKFLWTESPYQGALASILLQNMRIGGAIRARDLSWSPPLDKLVIQLGDKSYYPQEERETAMGVLFAAVEKFEAAIDDASNDIKGMVEHIGNEAVPQVWNRVGEKIEEQLIDAVYDRLWALFGGLPGASHVQTRDESWDELKNNVADRVLESAFQGHLAERNCYLDCFLRNLHLRAEEVIDPRFLWDDALGKPLSEFWGHCGIETVKSILEANKHCGHWWPLRGIVIAAGKHSSIHLDEWRRLHCENGMAIQYPDGWGVYAWKGVRVPEKAILAPETLTAGEIDMEPNAEIRRVLLERFGWGRYLSESGTQPVHKDRFGILYRRELPDDEPLVMVKVKNKTPEPDGSFREYFLRVPPSMETARQAVAWTFAMDQEEYKPLAET